MKYFEFPCGCRFPQVETEDGTTRIKFDANIENIPLDCKRTWNLISDGNTKGVFQLESHLGRHTAKQLQPQSIEHLSALVAIIRPGCRDSIQDGKSITDHYIDRKNGKEPVEYLHPILKKSLSPTYGELIYQEQSMRIAQDVAGFDLQQADILRKAIGKKKPEIMAQCKDAFLAGAKEQAVVTEEEAAEIFSWIEKSQRYSFNKSHSVSYAINAYLSAYVKAHFPRVFFTSYLYYAKEKQKPQDEVNELVNNAKLMDIDVYPPDVRHLNDHFRLIEKKIYFGLSDIKGIGASVIQRLGTHIDLCVKNLKKPIGEWTWLEFLIHLSQNVTSTAIKALISSGALPFFKMTRTQMLFEYEVYSSLSKREQAWVQQREFKSIQHMLEVMIETPSGKMGACATKRRVEKISGILASVKNPAYNMDDTPIWIASIEEALLGIPLTCTVVDSCSMDAANCTCRDFIKGSRGKQDVILIGCKVDRTHEHETKRGKTPGQKMGFVSVSDNTGLLESVVVFTKEWASYKNLLTEDNTVMLQGKREAGKESFIIQKVFQI